MSELLVTQCPHCQTRFRLTPAQLSMANGYVRCGACLEVFHAADAAAALTDHPAEPASEQAVAEAPNALGAPRAAHAQDSLLQDDLDDPQDQESQEEPDLAALGLDESIISEVNPDSPLGMGADEQSTPLTDLHEDFLATPPARDFGPAFDHNRTGLYQRLAEDEGYSDKGIFQRDHPAAVDPAPDSSAQQAQGPADDQSAPSAPVPPLPEPAPGLAIDQDEESDDPAFSSRDERQEPALTSLQVELLEEELLAPPVRQRPPSWLWTSLALLALLALPAQYLYYNFDALAHDQRSRPMLENICLLARCELPARVDISRIRSTNLLVRPHPEFPNALAIDVILYNRADFEQPFPVLEMQFTDAAGRRLASRRFRPEEYLSGELAGARLMPSQTPIRVGLSMLSPGTQARNYQLEFLSP